MKKFILLLLVTAFLAACSKKQDVKQPLTPQNATAKDLAGKWSIVADTIYTTTNGQTKTTINAVPDGLYFQFNTDGTGAESIQGNSDPLTYKVSGGIIAMSLQATANLSAEDISVSITMITTTKLALHLINNNQIEAIGLIKD